MSAFRREWRRAAWAHAAVYIGRSANEACGNRLPTIRQPENAGSGRGTAQRALRPIAGLWGHTRTYLCASKRTPDGVGSHVKAAETAIVACLAIQRVVWLSLGYLLRNAAYIGVVDGRNATHRGRFLFGAAPRKISPHACHYV